MVNSETKQKQFSVHRHSKECLFDSDENGSEKEKVPVVEPIVYNDPDYGFNENDDSD